MSIHRNCLFCCSYNPNKNNISKHLHCLSKDLDTYISQYDNIMLLGDLNIEISDPVLKDFCNVYNLFSLAQEPTCFKNRYNPSFPYKSSTKFSKHSYHRNRYQVSIKE